MPIRTARRVGLFSIIRNDLTPVPRYHEEVSQVAVRRGFWWGLLAAIIAAGLLSRVAHTGIRLVDKYAGDALYAAMVYVLFRLTGRIVRLVLWTAVAMTAIELFQLTQVPAGMLHSGNAAVRACARLLGTEFSFLDLLAYAVGIGCMAAADRAESLTLPRKRTVASQKAGYGTSSNRDRS
jgi:hypothetical protein